MEGGATWAAWVGAPGVPAVTAIHAVAASSDAPGVQPGEGSPQLTLLLHTPEDFSQTRYVIREVSHETASRWYARWHYLGDPQTASVHWGIFAPDLGAVVDIGLPNNAYGVAARLGLEDIPGNLEIGRVAVHPDMPAHTSRLMWLVVKAAQRRDGWSWCYSYADIGQGHHGGIYQALSAVYVGLTVPAHMWQRDDGTLMHPRQAVSIYGSQATETMNQRGYTKVPGTQKHTYVLPVGPRAAEVRARLAHLAQPYPKRDAA